MGCNECSARTTNIAFRSPVALRPNRSAQLIFLETQRKSLPVPPEMEEVSAVEAIPLLMNLTHQAYLLQATGQLREKFSALRPGVSRRPGRIG